MARSGISRRAMFDDTDSVGASVFLRLFYLVGYFTNGWIIALQSIWLVYWCFDWFAYLFINLLIGVFIDSSILCVCVCNTYIYNIGGLVTQKKDVADMGQPIIL